MLVRCAFQRRSWPLFDGYARVVGRKNGSTPGSSGIEVGSRRCAVGGGRKRGKIWRSNVRIVVVLVVVGVERACGLGACEQDSTSRIEASLSADAQAHGSGRSSLVPAQVSSSAALLKRLFTTSGNGRGTTLQRRTQRALAPLCTPDALALWHATELLQYRPVLAGVQAADSLSPLHATWAATATPSLEPATMPPMSAQPRQMPLHYYRSTRAEHRCSDRPAVWLSSNNPRRTLPSLVQRLQDCYLRLYQSFVLYRCHGTASE